jgi:transcriptional regulator
MLLAGTLDLLVLRTLIWGPRHGYAIARWINESSRDAIQVEDRALYLSLHRLDERGFVVSEWALSENNRRAKFYELTAEGRRQLRIKERALRTTSMLSFGFSRRRKRVHRHDEREALRRPSPPVLAPIDVTFHRA